MSNDNAWKGTCGFHGSDDGDDQPAGFWPLGSVAFRTTSGELHRSAVALRAEAEFCDHDGRVEILTSVAQWYEDLALDLAEIQSLPEVHREVRS